MTPLRQRMIDDMRLRNFSRHTEEAYVRAVASFVRHFKRPPQELTPEDVRQYLLHLVQQRRVSWSLYNQARCALQFFYRVTLGRTDRFDGLPCAREPKRIPTVLSPEELQRMFTVAANLKERAILMTLYGAGLRASELCSLRQSSIVQCAAFGARPSRRTPRRRKDQGSDDSIPIVVARADVGSVQ